MITSVPRAGDAATLAGGTVRASPAGAAVAVRAAPLHAASDVVSAIAAAAAQGFFIIRSIDACVTSDSTAATGLRGAPASAPGGAADAPWWSFRTLCARRGITLSLGRPAAANQSRRTNEMIQLSWRRIAAVAIPIALAAVVRPAQGQVNDSLRLRDRQRPLVTDTTPADSARARRRARQAVADTAGLPHYRISPRSAFLRSLVLPGWGQSSIGAPGRGAVYFALESGSLWMVYKSGQKLQEARQLERTMHEDGTLDLTRTLPLVRARRNEREDWITLSVFWFFFSGADAYVAAHLRDFDTHVDVEPGPTGGTQLRLNLPLGN
jgi:hypothetical protein